MRCGEIVNLTAALACIICLVFVVQNTERPKYETKLCQCGCTWNGLCKPNPYCTTGMPITNTSAPFCEPYLQGRRVYSRFSQTHVDADAREKTEAMLSVALVESSDPCSQEIAKYSCLRMFIDNGLCGTSNGNYDQCVKQCRAVKTCLPELQTVMMGLGNCTLECSKLGNSNVFLLHDILVACSMATVLMTVVFLSVIC